MKKNKGFSLVEVIIAAAILAIVTIPVLGVFVQISNVNLKSRLKQKGTDLAEDMVESLREYAITEILTDASLGNPEFLQGYVSGYSPDYIHTADVQGTSEGQHIYGDLTVKEGQTISNALRGLRKVSLSFTEIDYSGSKFDVLMDFEIIVGDDDIYADNEEYYLYDTQIRVYRSGCGFTATGLVASQDTGIISREEEDEGEKQEKEMNLNIGDPLLYAMNEFLTQKLDLSSEGPMAYGRLRLSRGVAQYNNSSYQYTDVYGYTCYDYERKTLSGQAEWEPGYFRILTYSKESWQSLLQQDLYDYLANTDNDYNTRYIFTDWSHIVINYVEAYLEGDGTNYYNDSVKEVTGYQLVQDNMDGTYTVYTKKGRNFTYEENKSGVDLRASETVY